MESLLVNSIQLAKIALKNKANYLAFGAFYLSKTKKTKYKASLSLLKKAKDLKNQLLLLAGLIQLTIKNFC